MLSMYLNTHVINFHKCRVKISLMNVAMEELNLKKAMQLLEAPNTIYHGSATLTKVHDNVAQIFLPGNPVLAAGTYYVDVYKLSVDRNNLDYLEAPLAWLPIGYSPNNPNNSQENEVVTTTSSYVQASTYFIM